MTFFFLFSFRDGSEKGRSSVELINREEVRDFRYSYTLYICIIVRRGGHLYSSSTGTRSKTSGIAVRKRRLTQSSSTWRRSETSGIAMRKGGYHRAHQ